MGKVERKSRLVMTTLHQAALKYSGIVLAEIIDDLYNKSGRIKPENTCPRCSELLDLVNKRISVAGHWQNTE